MRRRLLCAGEGGMVLSNERALLERIKSLREYDGARGTGSIILQSQADRLASGAWAFPVRAVLCLSGTALVSSPQRIGTRFLLRQSSVRVRLQAGHMDTIDLSSGSRMHRPIMMVLRMSLTGWSSRGFTAASLSFARFIAIWISLVSLNSDEADRTAFPFHSIPISQTTKSCRFSNR